MGIRLTSQVLVAAGTVSVLHVGGYQDAAASPQIDDDAAVPSWEFFIADRPHAPPVDGRRQPFVQIADADRLVRSGTLTRTGSVPFGGKKL